MAGSSSARSSSANAPVSIGELELDMGMVVIEGDVFAIENRELKKAQLLGGGL